MRGRLALDEAPHSCKSTLQGLLLGCQLLWWAAWHQLLVKMTTPASLHAMQTWIQPAEHPPEHAACAGKVLNLLPDHVYASVIRCIQLQRHVRHGTAVNLAGYSQYGGRLASARGPIQQQVWEAVLACELLDCSAK